MTNNKLDDYFDSTGQTMSSWNRLESSNTPHEDSFLKKGELYLIKKSFPTSDIERDKVYMYLGYKKRLHQDLYHNGTCVNRRFVCWKHAFFFDKDVWFLTEEFLRPEFMEKL